MKFIVRLLFRGMLAIISMAGGVVWGNETNSDLDLPALENPSVAATDTSVIDFPSSNAIQENTMTATTNAAETGSEPVVPPQLDRALRDTHKVLASPNLLTNLQAPVDADHVARLKTTLELGRKQHKAKDFEPAEKSFVSILQEDAPAELHRSALLELALVVQDAKQYPRAQQVYSQYVQRFHDDANVPEILLRQGLLYREMGAPILALSKFYSVMSSALTARLEPVTYYQRLVLHAQTEIADTYYLDGQFNEAADFFNRLLKLDSPELNREQVLYKLVRSWSAAKHYNESLAQARLFAEYYPGSEYLPEVRFLLADALKHLGRTKEATQEVLMLVQSQRAVADQDRQNWIYWQQKTGNVIANELYAQGDFVEALEIYLRLAEVNTDPNWRLPTWYQAGVIYERLHQADKAAEMYTRILEEGKGLAASDSGASLGLILDMARWRKTRLAWQTGAELANQQMSHNAKSAPAVPANP
jgi:tetratricopeptide (TPR) repeat protein